MLPNGNLIGTQGKFIFEMDPQGRPAWEYESPLPMHHDYAKLPNGNVLLLATRERSAEEAIAAGANPEFVGPNGIVSDVILEIRPIYPVGGEMVWQWDVWDHLIQDFDPNSDDALVGLPGGLSSKKRSRRVHAVHAPLFRFNQFARPWADAVC